MTEIETLQRNRTEMQQRQYDLIKEAKQLGIAIRKVTRDIAAEQQDLGVKYSTCFNPPAWARGSCHECNFRGKRQSGLNGNYYKVKQ